MEPPKSSSILRKSSNIRKPIRCVRFTKAVVRHANIRDQKPSLGVSCPGDPHQRNPNAPKFEDRSQEETERQERYAREAAWKMARCILKLKEKHETTFFSPSENRSLPSPSTIKPEAREFVVDSGASMHMISKKDLNSAELETVTTSRSPTTVITANGEVQTNEEAIVYVKELDIFWTTKVIEDTPAVLSLGKLCDEHRYSCEWINGQKPHLIKNGIRTQCNTENFVPVLVPGLSTSSSSSLPSSTPTTSSTVSSDDGSRVWGDLCGIDHHPATVSSERVEKQERGDPYSSETSEELLNKPNKTPQNQIKMRITSKYGKTRTQTYQNGFKNSERILWMTEFLNTETHTRVLLMNFL